MTAALALVFSASSACTDRVETPPAPHETVVETAGDRVTVVGTVPQATPNASSIVYLESHAELDVPPPTTAVLLDQLGRTFIPSIVLIRAGQPLLIRNSENDLHNVRIIESATGEMLLNIGMIMGATHVHTFDRPGTYTVQCDIHTTMFADIVVTTTPYVAVTDQGGRFSLPDVPVGSYTLAVIFGDQQLERVVEIDESGTPLTIVNDDAAP